MGKSEEEMVYNYIRGVLKAFLEGKQHFNWVFTNIIDSHSRLRDQGLKQIFEDLKGYGDLERYRQIHAACREQGWLE